MRNLMVFSLFFWAVTGEANQFVQDLVAAGHERTQHSVRYDGAYVAIDYPGGDVPKNTGVCTDVIVRAYRALGTDLQQLVHEDMLLNFDDYPSKRIWGLSQPDSHIDHRRVPNLQAFFRRHGRSLKVSKNSADYHPGDLVTWMLPGNLPHIGIVSDQVNAHTSQPMIIHNIGRGPALEDMLFRYKVTGHYQYLPINYKAQR